METAVQLVHFACADPGAGGVVVVEELEFLTITMATQSPETLQHYKPRTALQAQLMALRLLLSFCHASAEDAITGGQAGAAGRRLRQRLPRVVAGTPLAREGWDQAARLSQVSGLRPLATAAPRIPQTASCTCHDHRQPARTRLADDCVCV